MTTIPAAAPVSFSAVESGEPTGIVGWAVALMESLGAVGAGLLVALENVFPPLPSEAILPLAGFAASRGDLTLAGALVWTTIGSVLGALLLYWIGAVVGLRRIRAAARRLPLVDVADVDRTMAWFHRHGGRAVFFGRMLPVFRSLISIPAGIDRMPLPRFVVLTGLGSALWNTAFVLAGYFLGENWHVVEEYAGILQVLVLGAVAVLATVWLVRRIRRRGAGSADH